MTNKKNSKSKNTPAALPPLLPLEYCRIDRAARLLGCEVEDIIHWGMIGAIKLGYKISKQRGSLITGRKEFSSSQDVIDWSGNRDEFFIHKHLSAYASFAAETDNKLRDDGGSYPDVLSLSGFASGVWFISSHEVEFISDSGGINVSGQLTIVMTADSFDNLSPIFAAMPDADEKVSFKPEDMIVTKAELEKLYHSITTGEPLPNIHNNAELAQKAQEQDRARAVTDAALHHNKERHAANREPVLKAALYCKKHFPEKCKTYVEWAETIDEKAPLFWPETGKPPLSRARVERLLGEAHKLPADR